MGTNKKFCPNCGAPLDDSSHDNKIICRYCGNVIEVEQSKEKQTYQSKTTIAEDPVCEVRFVDTFIWCGDTVQKIERVVAIREGEKRKINYAVFNTNVKRKTVTQIEFRVRYKNEIIKKDIIEDMLYDINTSYAEIENRLTDLKTGIYYFSFRIGNSKWYEFPFIVGSPKELDAVYSAENREKCVEVIKDILARYAPKNKYTTIITDNNYSVMKKEKVTRKHLGIPESIPIYLFYDGSLTGNGKKGLAICSDGIYFNGSMSSKKHIDWYHFLLSPISTKFGLDIGDLSIFGAQEADKMALLLGKLQRGIVNSIF